MSIVIKNLEKSYDVPILRNINLEILQGQILGIIGKSGAGKSTLLRCMNGLEQPNRGTIVIDGQKFTEISNKQRNKIQQKIGNIFQNFNLLSRLTVLENILFPLELLKRKQKNSYSKAIDLLTMVRLQGKENVYPSQLSGGQLQRVAIARALITDAAFLLCDEFTSALDSETTLEILELLRDLNKKLGVTIVLITHDMAIIREICDEVCVLDQGRIVEKNDITSILLYPQNKVTKSLLRNLIIKDLPHHLRERLSPSPFLQCSILLRLFFSNQIAEDPIIAFIVKKYDLPINILFGNLDHIRETAFGCLIIEIPYLIGKIDEIINELNQKDISSEILGYLPLKEESIWKT